jgi:hypothetical protein
MNKKFAILIMGYLRSFEYNIPYFKKMFEDYDVFVFSVESDKHYKILQNLAIKNFKLVKDESINIQKFNIYNDLFLNPKTIALDSNLPKENLGWLKQLRDYKLAINWFNSSFSEKYEYIVRYRPDLKPINYKNINFINNKFNCFQQNTYVNQVNDKFFLGNKENITFFMDNIFESLNDKNISRYADKPFNVEQYIFSFLEKNNIPINYLDKNSLKFKKNVDGKLLSAGFNQYGYKTLKNRLFD